MKKGFFQMNLMDLIFQMPNKRKKKDNYGTILLLDYRIS